MALMLISYDLMKTGQNYDSVFDALKKQGAKRVLYSQWALKTSSSAQEVRDWLRQYMDVNDRILVCEINSDWASYGTLVDPNTI